ncbi:hypothetical protein [Streptomyces sp. ODS28]|uniref:hypothetical protein n=1 Tax=Streptomyces sp. ODS28 TaxID=3136688 RepID=UPI0031E567A7
MTYEAETGDGGAGGHGRGGHGRGGHGGDHGGEGGTARGGRGDGGAGARQRGVLRTFRTALATLARNRRPLCGQTLRITGLGALGGVLLTGAAFAIAWPYFTEMWDGALEAQAYDGDSYYPETQGALNVMAATLPFLLLLGALCCAALQTVHSRALDGASPLGGRAFWRRERARVGSAFGVYVLRGILVWAVVAAGILTQEILTTTKYQAPTIIPPHTLGSTVVKFGAPLLAMCVALLLRLGFSLAPAAAVADGLNPLAALGRSWSLVWRGGAWPRTAAVTLPAGLLVVGVYVAVQYAAGPLHNVVASAFLAHITEIQYVAYAAAVLTPVAVATLASGALTLPFAHTVLAARYAALSGREVEGRRAT